MFARRLKGIFQPTPSRKVRWILVASQSGARIFEQVVGSRDLSVVARMEHPDGRRLSHETKEGKPGRTFSSWAGNALRHAMETEMSPHMQEAQRFAKMIDVELERGREEKRYDELILVAEPRFLGILSDRLTHEAKRRVVGRIKKDLANLKDDQVVAHLQTAANIS